MRSFALAALLLLAAIPSALATCAADACADVRSADDGSCGGAGSEENAASASLPGAQFREFVQPWGGVNETRVQAHSYCVRSDEQEYREIRVNATTDPFWLGPIVHDVQWSWDGADCRTVVYHTFRQRAEIDALGCPAGAPPGVPALLP